MCLYLPLRFTENDQERIANVFTENFTHFFLDKRAEYFTIKVRVFSYPNNVNSIRIILIYYKKDQIVEADEEETDDPKKNIEAELKSFVQSDDEEEDEKNPLIEEQGEKEHR